MVHRDSGETATFASLTADGELHIRVEVVARARYQLRRDSEVHLEEVPPSVRP